MRRLSAPAAAPGSVQAVMAMAAKVAQQQLADKKKKDEEERLKGFGADWQSWDAGQFRGRYRLTAARPA